MIKPEQIKAFNDLSSLILEPIKEELLKDISRRIEKCGKITETAKYQMYRAVALNASKDEFHKLVEKQSQNITQDVTEIFDNAAKAAYEGRGSTAQTVDAYSKIATQSLLDLIIKNLGAPTPQGKVVSLFDVYRTTMDFAFRQIVTGASDSTTALRKATRQLAERGIREIPRNNGRSVSVEYAGRNYIMNQLGLMNQEITRRNHDELGHNGWEISAHAGSAPDHEPIQGRQFPDKLYEKMNGRLNGKYDISDPDLLQRPIGTLGCQHWAFSVNMDIQKPQYTTQQLQKFIDDNNEGTTYNGVHYTMYEAGQEQASLEARIRKIKDKCLIYENLNDAVKLRSERINLSRHRDEYSRFSKAAGLPLRNERIQIAGFGRSEAAKARAAFNAQYSNSVYQINISGEISPKDRSWIEKELSMIPENHKKYIETQISSISVVQGANKSTYQRSARKIKLSDTAPQGAVIHECAHALEKALDIFNDPKFIKTISNGLKDIALDDIIVDNKTFSEPVTRVLNPKFISEYQGVLSINRSLSNNNEIDFKAFTEYFSEGYREYLTNPERLKRLDNMLFNYMEGIN